MKLYDQLTESEAHQVLVGDRNAVNPVIHAIYKSGFCITKKGYYCPKCEGTSTTSSQCENPDCPNQPCCGRPKKECDCHEPKERLPITKKDTKAAADKIRSICNPCPLCGKEDNKHDSDCPYKPEE